MGVHAALGQAGRARGVGQQRQVVGRGGVRAGHAVRGERVGPADVAGRQLDVGPQPGFHRRRRRVGLADRAFGHGVGEAGDQHPARALRLGQRRLGGGDDGHQVGGADDDRGLGVGDVVAELLGPVHRVHRHHHRVGAQGRVERDRELRAVLHEEGDAVALADAFPLQPAGQRLGLGTQLGEADAAAEEDVRRLVRKARRRHLDVEPERGLGHRQRKGQPLGPDAQVRTVGGHLEGVGR